MPDRASQFDDDVRAILSCPVCDDRPRLDPTDDDTAFRCPKCNRRYPIMEGIPQLVADDAIDTDCE